MSQINLRYETNQISRLDATDKRLCFCSYCVLLNISTCWYPPHVGYISWPSPNWPELLYCLRLQTMSQILRYETNQISRLDVTDIILPTIRYPLSLYIYMNNCYIVYIVIGCWQTVYNYMLNVIESEISDVSS